METNENENEVAEALAMPFKMPDKKIVAFCGPKGCGKTLAASIVRNEHAFELMSFAEPMRGILGTLLGEDHPALSRYADKTLPVPELEGQSMRHALQTLGTEWGRNCIGENIWVNHMKRRIENSSKNVVIDDLRFLNEAAMLEDLGATIIRIQRPQVKTDAANNHQSETEQKEILAEFDLENTGDEVEDLRQTIRRIMVVV